jgi:hypothetical protein
MRFKIGHEFLDEFGVELHECVSHCRTTAEIGPKQLTSSVS